MSGTALRSVPREAAEFVERRSPGAPPKHWPTGATELSRLSLVVADAIALTLALSLVRVGREIFFGPLPAMHWATWTAMLAWFVFRASSELYSPCGLYPPEELRRSFRTSAAAFVIHLAILVAVKELYAFRLAGLMLWVMVLPFTYALRTIARSLLIARGQYGVPVAVIGNGVAARRAIRELLARPELGFVPVAVFTSEKTEPGERMAVTISTCPKRASSLISAEPTQPRTSIVVWSTTRIASEVRAGRRPFQFSARSSSWRCNPASSVVVILVSRRWVTRRRESNGASCGI